MRKAISGVVLAMLVGACTAASSASPSSPHSSASPSPSGDPTASLSPDPRRASIDAEEARWVARQPSTYAFTFTHLGPSGVGWNWRYRVTSLDGRTQAQWLDGYTQSDDDLAQLSVDGLFDTARRELDGAGELRLSFEPDLGYPTEIAYEDPSVSDSGSTETATDFVSGTDDRAAHTREVLRSARAAWQRWEPTAYEYVWRRFGAAARPASGTAWHVQHADGRTSTEADPASDGALPAGTASVVSTFDAVDAALDAGAWVDLTVAPTSGLPLLVAIDPSPAEPGDEYWIRITFRDIQHEVAASALEEARTRWAAAGLQHFSYNWRYRGDLDPLTYGVTYDGDVSALRRSPGTPIPEARSYATPRIDDTFRLIDEVLAEGGHVSATYDPVLGFPVRVVIDPVGDAGARGTITIKDFEVR